MGGREGRGSPLIRVEGRTTTTAEAICRDGHSQEAAESSGRAPEGGTSAGRGALKIRQHCSFPLSVR